MALGQGQGHTCSYWKNTKLMNAANELILNGQSIFLAAPSDASAEFKKATLEASVP
jgi:hypothetical protein